MHSAMLKDISTPDFSTPDFSTPDFSTMNFSNPWFKNSWLKSPGLKSLGLKLGIEKSGVVTCDVHQPLFLLAETNLVARGETSADFYFHTLPSSPPTALTCEGNFDSLHLTWKYSQVGMYKDSNNQATKYKFVYQLSTSK